MIDSMIDSECEPTSFFASLFKKGLSENGVTFGFENLIP